MQKRLLYPLLSLASLFLFADNVWAEEPSCLREGVATLKCVPQLFNNVIGAGVALAAVAAVFLIIISGIRFLLSGGDQVKVASARKSLTFSIIGFLVIVLAFFIIRVFSAISGTDCSVIGVKC